MTDYEFCLALSAFMIAGIWSVFFPFFVSVMWDKIRGVEI